MTEFWRSTPKYYCKTCKVYLADNKQTRFNHDSSRSHKDKLLVHQQKLKDEQFHGLQNEYELKKTLHEIDKAARQAVLQDRQDFSTSFYQSGAPLYANHHHAASFASQTSHKNNGTKMTELSENSESLIQDNLRQDKSGRYIVNGVTYLEGTLNEDKLVGGVECEVFLEQLDDWLPCTIIRRKEYQIPNTSVMLKSYEVKFMYPADDKRLSAQEIVENDVKSENLRLILDETSEINIIDNDNREKIVVNEDTGIGGWQTVSIIEVNEEEEEKKRLEYEEERQKEQLKQEIERKELEQLMELKARDDAMSAYDPYGTNMYKGMNIAEGVIDYTEASVAKGHEVLFKKRKTLNNESKKMFRRKDDE